MPLIPKGKRLLLTSSVPSREKRDYSSGCERVSKGVTSTIFSKSPAKLRGRPLFFDQSEVDRAGSDYGDC